MSLLLALVVVIATVYFMIKGVEVRLVLFASALALSLLAGSPFLLLEKFEAGMIDAIVIPICSAMGFAAVLRYTECDKHLSALLLKPAKRFGVLLLPLGMFVAYIVNIALPSQASTAAAVGPVLLPLLYAAGFNPALSGAALILGASFGGDLLNPAAQDILIVSRTTGLKPYAITEHLFLPCILGFSLAVSLFCFKQRQAIKQRKKIQSTAAFKIHLFKAFIPMVPLVLIFITTPQFHLLAIPRYPSGLPVLYAMLIGSTLALIANGKKWGASSKTFFTGMGESYGSVISLTIVARCFGMAVGFSGLTTALLELAKLQPVFLRLASVIFPGGLALLSGSGSGPIAAYVETILAPLGSSAETLHLSSLACVAGAIGRTLSPVAAVVVYTATLSECQVKDMLRLLWLPTLLGAAATMLLIFL